MLRVDGVPPLRGGTGVTFDVPHGQCVGVLAQDSPELTSLFRAAAAIRRPAAGRVLIDGRDTVNDTFGVRRLVVSNFVSAAHSRLTISEYLGLIANARKANGAHLRLSPAAALTRLCIDGRRSLNEHRASAEVALAAALLPVVSVIVLDEPFSGVSDDARAAAIEWIRALSSEPTSVVIGSAAERDVRAVSHRVITLEIARWCR